MDSAIIIHQEISNSSSVEMVESKGIGHPDTICDNLAEEVSKALCKYYLENFGRILHYNVDKALLVGGQAQTSFGGGRIILPIDIFIAGRATTELSGKKIPVEEIAREAMLNWLGNNMRYLDNTQHVRIHVKIRSGSSQLTALNENSIPLSNDTSFGVGFFPFTALEKDVLQLSGLLNSAARENTYPFLGEDTKIMGVRTNEEFKLTIAAAMVDKYVSGVDDYLKKKELLWNFLSQRSGSNYIFEINQADEPDKESLYLTVTGTSAENGDDGQVGRGNRINGLITPYRPMSLEAVSGKNPVNHTGKLYNLFAQSLAKEIVEQKLSEHATVFAVSQIGKPINEPYSLDIHIGNASNQQSIKQLAADLLSELPNYWKNSSGQLSGVSV